VLYEPMIAISPGLWTLGSWNGNEEPPQARGLLSCIDVGQKKSALTSLWKRTVAYVAVER